jgi:hypothetical protein
MTPAGRQAGGHFSAGNRAGCEVFNVHADGRQAPGTGKDTRMSPARGRSESSCLACGAAPKFNPGMEQEGSMRNLVLAILMMAIGLGALPLRAQQPCPRLSVVINTPEDKLMLAVNGAENPQEQIAALTKFQTEHADSTFIPCVNEYLTKTYVKTQQYDQAIEAGEKDLAANYLDLNLMLNLVKAYVGSGKASDNAFTLIAKTPQQIKEELAPVSSATATAAENEKARQQTEELGKEISEYMEYAFFQLLPHVTDMNKRIQDLDEFVKFYPNSPNMGQVNVQYFVAYQALNKPDKMFEYGEKAAASDATNASTLNLVADGYSTAQIHLDEAEQHATKALDLLTNMQKPANMTDDQFKSFHDIQTGLAHSTLGYVDLQKGGAKHRVATAIKELKQAADLLEGNPALEGRTLFYLGYAYELSYPANHHLAYQALSKAAGLQSPWQAQAQDLLEKVKKAGGR